LKVDSFDVKFLNLDCERCEKILQLIETRQNQHLDTTYNDIQKGLFGTTNHNGHHHSMDNCINRLESLNFIRRNERPFYQGHKTDKRKVFFKLDSCILYGKTVEGVLITGWLSIWDIFDTSPKINCLETFLTKNSFKCKNCGALGKFSINDISEDISFVTLDYLKISYDCSVCGFSYSYDYYY
jgi:hypothetical protein